MFGLPTSTEISQQLPKKAIFDKFDLNTAQRERFDKDISRMTLVNAISPTTIPAIQVGKEVECIYVVHVVLKKQNYDAKNIILLNQLIPQKMVFALRYENQVQLVIFHNKLIVGPWKNDDVVSLYLQGLDLDEVWYKLVMDIGCITIEDNKTLEEQFAIDETKAKLKKEIETLEKKSRNEKQPRKKLELYEELRNKRRTMLELFQK